MTMCSPVSPKLTQYVMDGLIDDFLSRVNFETYVDDIILCTPQDKLHELLLVFNSHHQKLQFTVEEEDMEHSIPFLDTKVIRKMDNSLITCWYMVLQEDFYNTIPLINTNRKLTFHSRNGKQSYED